MYSARQRHVSSSWAVIALCALVVIAEGYDLIVYGALLPSLLEEPEWGLTSASAGVIGSMVYIGMLLGALGGGRLTDRFGRRRFIIVAVAWFMIFTAACALAATPWQLGVFRLLAGVGMGGVMPAALALAKEYSPTGRTGLTVTILMAGVPIGGTTAALLALNLLPTHGWRLMFWIGAAMSALILVVSALWLPESSAFLRQRGETARYRDLFGPRVRIVTILFAVAAFTSLLTWYGVNTWLVTLMRELGYPLSSALQFSLTLNVSAVLSSFAFAAAGDRCGTRPVAAACLVLTATGIGLCAIGTGSVGLLLVFIALIGMGAHSALNLINASVGDTYPVSLRGTALGWSNGIGRLGAVVAPSLGGWVLGGFGPRAVFVAFLLAALCSAATLVILTVRGRGTNRTVGDDQAVLSARMT